MIEIGKYNYLKVLRKTSIGFYLGTESQDVLLPGKYCPRECGEGDALTVFVYPDNEGRMIATTQKPKIRLYEFASLTVSAVTKIGIFLDWGLDKELLLPFGEKKKDLNEGESCIVYLALDEKRQRLYASAKVEKYLQNEKLTVAEKDQVNILVQHRSDLGFSVIVNNRHKGVIYTNEIFREVKAGDILTGYVKRIRGNNNLDISLQPIGFEDALILDTDVILDALKRNSGFLSLTDKSSPQEISSRLGMSKKAFKRAVGTLYKSRTIDIRENGIQLLEEK